MPETTTTLPNPPPAAKLKGRPPRPRLGEIYKGDCDYDEILSEISWDPTTEVDPAVRRAALRPLKPTGDLEDAWKHLRRRWKIVIIVSFAGMLILGLLNFLLPYFVPQGSMHQYVSNKSLHATAPVGTWKAAVKPRFWFESSQTTQSSTPTPSTPESTVVLVPVPFKA